MPILWWFLAACQEPEAEVSAPEQLPTEFVIERPNNHHFSFAGGPHRCLGAHLARGVMRLAVEEWLRALPDFELAASEPLIERGGGSMNALLELPLRWEVVELEPA